MDASRETDCSISEGHRRRRCRIVLFFASFLALAGCGPADTNAALGGDPAAGAAAVTRHACGSCHDIPGIQDADGRVGPSLAGFGLQRLIAGRLPNSPEELRLYLRDPQGIVPGNVMPNQGLTEREARDIAAFLEAQR